jgi:hypothetical protein
VWVVVGSAVTIIRQSWSTALPLELKLLGERVCWRLLIPAERLVIGSSFLLSQGRSGSGSLHPYRSVARKAHKLSICTHREAIPERPDVYSHHHITL